ncbi:MAG TPA: hypothetical protein ENJ13_04555 [Chromatiales bacterium]|nr:hypothetical protein [Chromatiales bacterium]
MSIHRDLLQSNSRAILFVGFIIMLSSMSVNGQPSYTPPAGIPAPEFGIDEVAPTWPAGWPSQETANFYYIDNTHIDATDSSNTYGTPNRPRATIPEIVYAEGAYVEIHGGPYSGGGQIIFTGNGTEENPVWIRGESTAIRGNISAEMIVKGSYIIIENLVFSNDYAVIGIRPHNGAHAHHVSVRNNEMYGSATDVGFRSAIGISGPVENRNHNIVVYNNLIYDRGDYRPSSAGENDYHGVAPSRNVDRVWILNNEIYHMGGDSVQVGVANIPDNERPDSIYIAGNNFHENFENALDIKESNNIFAVDNDFHNFRDAAVVIHNYPDSVWIINNRVHNAYYGIASSGGTNVWYIGNSIWNIHTRNIDNWEANSGYSDGAAIHFRASDGGAVNNTMYNYDTGIQLTTSGPYVLSNNLFSTRSQAAGFDIRVANSSVSSITNIENSIFDEDSNINWGDGNAITLGELKLLHEAADGSYIQPNALNSPSTGDFTHAIDSKALNGGNINAVYERFYQTYGLRIDEDINGNPRVSGQTIDIGSIEEVIAPNPPSSVYISVKAN